MAYQDLLKDTSKPDPSNSNYFLVTVSDLEVNQSYPIQFRWKYNDGTFSPWSAVRVVTTPGESSPNTPRFAATNVDVTTPGFLKITWDGNSDDNTALTDIDRVDVYISGAPFVGNVVAATFKTAGTQSISVPGGTYQIVLYAVSKLGKLSPVSAAVTKTVNAIGIPVQTPTLPSGITVSTAPFAVTVNWPGTYSASTFTGFKSINIYAVASDLGSSVTSGISSTNLVGSLTVNNTPNKINISLDNLKQALSLSSTSDAYTSTIFYYFNATNTDNTQYGSPTYTRINSTSVVPTKVNFVDLVSGVISIENLVAGNGSFSSWLRAGTAGGARIELSATSDFTNGGNTVQKGLVAYSSGNTELFNLDLDASTLTINGSGTFTGDLSIGSGASIFKSDSYGIYLGNTAHPSPASPTTAPFSVSRNGILKAESGTIGGWTLGPQYLQNAGINPTIKIDTTGIIVGATSSSYIDITSSGITHRNSNGTASGKFTLSTGASPSLTINGTFTIDGSSTINGTAASTVVSNAATGSTAIQSGNGVEKNVSNQIVRIGVEGGISVSTAVSGSRVELTSSGLRAYSGDTPTVSINSNGTASFAGAVSASSGNIGTWNINPTTGVLSSGTTSLYGGVDSTSIHSDDWCIFDNSKKARFYGVSVSAWGIQSSGDITTTGSGDILLSGSGDLSLNTKTTLYGNGRIFADTLGTSTRTPGSGVTIIQDTSGFLRVYAASSSQRYKENIASFDTNGTYNIIKEMRPVKFNYKPEFSDYPEQEHLGLIAEEVHDLEANGDLVIYKDGIPDSIAYEKIPMYLVSAFKEMANKIDSLQSRLDALEG